MAKFRFATCKGVRSEDSILEAADFQGPGLAGVVFRDFDLRRAEMSGVTLAGAHLRGSDLDGLPVGPQELRGAIVDPPQAGAVTRLLGLTVPWAEAPGDAGVRPLPW